MLTTPSCSHRKLPIYVWRLSVAILNAVKCDLANNVKLIAITLALTLSPVSPTYKSSTILQSHLINEYTLALLFVNL